MLDNRNKSTNASEEETELWQDFLSITPDPPERRDKCESCK